MGQTDLNDSSQELSGLLMMLHFNIGSRKVEHTCRVFIGCRVVFTLPSGQLVGRLSEHLRLAFDCLVFNLIEVERL